MELKTGLKHRYETVVGPASLASSMDSGALDVYATPSMIAMMEGAAMYSVQPYLDEGCSTVGSLVNIKHIAPTPEGAKVWCDCELLEIDGSRLVFRCEAYDEFGMIGEGTHERFIIDVDRFIKRVDKKRTAK